MRVRRVKALARKEFMQMTRDIQSLLGGLFLPLLMIFLFGYALSLDVDRIPTLVLDQDRTPLSRRFISLLGDSRYFAISGYLEDQTEIDPALDRGDALLVLVLPADFSTGVTRGMKTVVQAVLDGSDSNTASIALGYLKAVAAGFDFEIQSRRIRKAGLRMVDMPVEARIRVWFNPEMKSRNFIVPGLTAVIMMAICSLMTALSVSKEKETGTMEQLLSTPISSGELLIGKLLPYLALGLIQLALIVGAGVIIFQVPFRGSYLDLLITALVFLTGTLSWGLFISVVSRSQLQASQIAMISAFLPSFLLSGFIYPIENMPTALQILTLIVPARYFVEILRGLFLQGVGLGVLWPEFLALIAYAALVLNLARKRFSKRLIR
ncbi:MAG: ABC transporter permease [Desulfobacteraceae bacterium]|nr:MAG: ABC transporter permease [Desulfobacteraceae bacterium]